MVWVEKQHGMSLKRDVWILNAMGFQWRDMVKPFLGILPPSAMWRRDDRKPSRRDAGKEVLSLRQSRGEAWPEVGVQREGMSKRLRGRACGAWWPVRHGRMRRRWASLMTATVLFPSSIQQSLVSTSRVPGSVPGAGSTKMKVQELVCPESASYWEGERRSDTCNKMWRGLTIKVCEWYSGKCTEVCQGTRGSSIKRKTPKLELEERTGVCKVEILCP